ncbi:MAG: hypothetical protein RML46_06615 [Anaerolineae bacterium]|nr:hypothetical protein [Anaerolineae bacterium]
MAGRLTWIQLLAASRGDPQARLTLLLLLVASQGSPEARLTLLQLLVASQGNPEARLTNLQLLVASQGDARIRVTSVFMEVLGVGVTRTSSAAMEVMAVPHQRRVSGAALEVLTRPPLRVSSGAMEILKGYAGWVATSAAMEVLTRDTLRCSGAALEIMRVPFAYLSSSAALEVMGSPFGAKVSSAAVEVLVEFLEEDLAIIDPDRNLYMSLSGLDIPLPRIEYYPAREGTDLPAGPAHVGRPRLVLVWDFARPEWIVTLFGQPWVEGRTWTVRRVIRAANIPIFRQPNVNVVKEFDCLVWRPAFHRDVEWDMGVWRDLRIECPILREYGMESLPWLAPDGS